MRLMLGTNCPTILVDVDGSYNPSNFTFSVVNGLWAGRFVDGTIHIDGNHGEPISGVNILSNDQNRLRGDYMDVFDNYGNPEWTAPLNEVDWGNEESWTRDDWDEDVPF